MKSGECREQPHPIVGECRVRKLLLDEMLQGKHQILNSQLALAQEETAGQGQAIPCIGGWGGLTARSCFNDQTLMSPLEAC